MVFRPLTFVPDNYMHSSSLIDEVEMSWKLLLIGHDGRMYVFVTKLEFLLPCIVHIHNHIHKYSKFFLRYDTEICRFMLNDCEVQPILSQVYVYFVSIRTILDDYVSPTCSLLDVEDS